jgi:hypothetical protein
VVRLCLMSEDGVVRNVETTMKDNRSLEFVARLKDRISQTSALGRLSGWLESNTTLHGKKYSFKDHEFQKAILDDKHPNIAVTKPSQVGMSETSARMMLGFLAVQTNTVGIYTLPTINEALRFIKSRIDPIIAESKYLASIIESGSDSSSFKKIGSSQLFAFGTYGKGIISVPTDLLVTDEVDFSNFEILKTAESRLSHSRFLDEELNIRGFRRKLSTPTLSGIGISALFEQGDKRRRLVRCKCGHWFWPDFLKHVVVQGFDKPFDLLTADDAASLDDRGLLGTAKLLCPSCHDEIKRERLFDEYREWVAESPSVKHTRSYAVSPFDLPMHHNPESILRKRIEYGNEEQHFRNFTLGLPYDSSSNSINIEAVRQCTVLNPVLPGQSISGCVAGLDVGKTSWLSIGKVVRVNGVEEIHVIWCEAIRVEDDSLFLTVSERLRQYGVVKAVVDSAPYFDTILRLRAVMPDMCVLPCSYVLNDRKLPPYIVKENELIVSANRTKVIDILARNINYRKMKFATFQEMGVVLQHLQNIKRVERTEDGDLKDAAWLKTGADHWAHSLTYLSMAADMVEVGEYINFAPMPSIKEAFVGKKYKQEK